MLEILTFWRNGRRINASVSNIMPDATRPSPLHFRHRERFVKIKDTGDIRVNQTNGLAAVTLPFPMNRLTRWRELREFLGVSDSQMHNLSNAGQLPAYVRIGRGKFFDPNDIANWLAARKSVA